MINKIVLLLAICVVLKTVVEPMFKLYIIESFTKLDSITKTVETIEHPFLLNCTMQYLNASGVLLVKDSKQEQFKLTKHTEVDYDYSTFFLLYNNTWDGCNCRSNSYPNDCFQTITINVCRNPVHPSEEKVVLPIPHIPWFVKVSLKTKKLYKEFYFDTKREDNNYMPESVFETFSDESCKL